VSSSYADALHAVTQAGGEPLGWPEDVYSLVVWAAIGCGDWPGTTPHADVVEQRQRGGDPGVVLEALAPSMTAQPPAVVLAAAWTGLRAVATLGQYTAIRAVPASISDRQIASRTQLTHTGVAKIRRPTGA
jgi:hypothetical protein